MSQLTKIALAGLFFLGLAGNSLAGRHQQNYVTVNGNHILEWDDETWFDIDDGSVLITHKERGEPRSTVEITETYELYVDDERVTLDADQQALVKDFHVQSMEILDLAKVLGWEGAKIGVEGARLGAKAVGCLFKLILPGYDTDDFENEIEQEADKIEAKAEKLEEKAEAIEDLADELDDLARDMRSDIPELRQLRWF